MMKTSYRELIWRSAVCLMFVLPGVTHAQSAAKVQRLQGIAHVEHGAAGFDLLYTGSELNVGDVVATEKDSNALLVFGDGSQVALRPQTRFVIRQYHFEQDKPGEDGMVVGLLKGGVRTLSGLIGKRGNQNAYQMQGGTATIGIRGTDFTARLCQGDCSHPSENEVAGVSSAGVVGHLVHAPSGVQVTDGQGAVRQIKPYGALFRSDTLQANSTEAAEMEMADHTRITLRPGSRLKLSLFHYQSRQESDGMLVDMLRGGFRVVTGLIAKKQPQQVNFHTLTATIGVRGTDFVLDCLPPGLQIHQGMHDCNGAMLLSMQDGSTLLETDQTSLLVKRGQSAYYDGLGSPARILTDSERSMLSAQSLPMPAITMVENLAESTGQPVPDGFYVAVNHGRIAFSQGGTTALLDRGDAAYTPGNDVAPVRLPLDPDFLDADPVLANYPFASFVCTKEGSE